MSSNAWWRRWQWIDTPRVRVRRWLIALLLASLLIIGAGIAVAADTDRPREFVTASTDAETPVSVYVGEELNISGVKLNGRSDTIGSGTVRLREVDGTETISVSGENANFQRASTGSYSADANRSAEIRVLNPRIDSFALYESNDEEVRVLDRVQQDSLVYLNAVWNFEEADALELKITDPDGLDVTRSVIDVDESEGGGSADVSVGNGEIGRSGQDVALDFSGLGSGEYTITATGTDFGPSASITVEVTGADAELDFEPSNVTRGERGVGVLAGFAGQRVILKVPASDVSNRYPAVTDSTGAVAVTNETAETLFVGNVEARIGGESLTGRVPGNADSHFYIPLTPDDDGRERVGINTEYFDANETLEVQLLRPTTNGSLETQITTAIEADQAELEIEPARISISDAPETIPAGGEFSIEGNTSAIDQLSVYARDGGTWYPVRFESGRFEKPLTNESFNVSVRARGRLNITDGYLLGLVNSEELRRQGRATNETLSSREFRQLDPVATVSTIAQQPTMEIHLGRSRLAVGSEIRDTITLRGQADGAGERIRVHVVGPRGALREPPVGAETRVTSRSVEFEFGTGLDQEGEYVVVAIAPGRDGVFAPTDTELNSIAASAETQTRSQTVERLVDAYKPVGGDDQVRTVSFIGQAPGITLDEVGANGRVPPGIIQLSGATNRGGSQNIDINLRRENRSLVRLTRGAVNDSANRWQATLNLSGLQSGTYTLRAAGPTASVSTQIRVVDPATPAEQFPTATPTQAVSGESVANQAGESPTETPEPQLLDLDFQTALQFIVGLLATVVLIAAVVLFRVGD